MQMTELKIFPYESIHHEYFVNLSLEWLKKYDLYEDADKPMLENPKEVILKKGGHIILAGYGNKIVGTVTLKKVDKSIFELLKLGVNSAHQGAGIGEKLMSYCIELCENHGAKKIILETNTKLENAIALYKKFNFKEIALSDMSYDMADFKMELILKK